MFKTMLNVENMLKISRHVENYNMCRKLCWNSMLKISACVEHCNTCWQLCQNFKACWKPYWKPCWSMKKRPSHFTARVEIEQHISFFSFNFTHVSPLFICIHQKIIFLYLFFKSHDYIDRTCWAWIHVTVM